MRAGQANDLSAGIPVVHAHAADRRGRPCSHAHVGFLARGQVHIGYADGCTREFKAPQVMAIEPGHDGWVVGDEAAIVIEFDFEGQTAERLGMCEMHHH